MGESWEARFVGQSVSPGLDCGEWPGSRRNRGGQNLGMRGRTAANVLQDTDHRYHRAGQRWKTVAVVPPTASMVTLRHSSLS